MKRLGRTEAMRRVKTLKETYAAYIRERFEWHAESCSTCPTPGICCVDEHFVNVRISRLEGEVIAEAIDALGPGRSDAVYQRAEAAVERYKLEPDSDETKTYACPLFERGVGCLVHSVGKPVPCITHACYEREEYLPPDELQCEQEVVIGRLNERVYRQPAELMPIPVAVLRSRSAGGRRALSSEQEELER